MGKTVQEVKNSLKFKASEKEGLLTVRVGVKKFVLPVAARLLSDGSFMFLSFGASSELYQIDGKKLVALDRDADGTKAFEALNVSRKKGGRRKSNKAELPDAVKAALSAIPAGHRLAIGPDGQYRLVKTRTRSKK